MKDYVLFFVGQIFNMSSCLLPIGDFCLNFSRQMFSRNGDQNGGSLGSCARAWKMLYYKMMWTVGNLRSFIKFVSGKNVEGGVCFQGDLFSNLNNWNKSIRSLVLSAFIMSICLLVWLANQKVRVRFHLFSSSKKPK